MLAPDSISSARPTRGQGDILELIVIDYSRLPLRQEVSAFADISYIDVGQLTGISNHETIAPVATPKRRRAAGRSVSGSSAIFAHR
jgi:hypothetical protein